MKNKKIKVLFRHRSMEMGGVEKVLLSMLNNLDRDKFDISLALNLHQGELRDQIPEHISLKTLAKGKEDFPKNKFLYKAALILRGLKLLTFRKFPWIVGRLILRNDADVEIATGYTMFSDVANSSNKKSKKIGWLHSDLSLSGFDPIRKKLFNDFQKFDYVIYGSQQSKDILEQKFPDLKFPPGKVILNAIPIEELKKKSIEHEVHFEKKPTFVSVGRLHYRKGYRTLLEVHKDLISNGFIHEINIIGNGEDYDYLKSRIQELGVEGSFKLLGTLMNPYPYVKNADFYIMPSESEGWPLIIAETLILQKPIIATNVGGIPEMIIHKKNGFLCGYNEVEIYNAMKVFMTKPELVASIQRNLKDSENQFDNQKIFDTVEEIILNLRKNE